MSHYICAFGWITAAFMTQYSFDNKYIDHAIFFLSIILAQLASI